PIAPTPTLTGKAAKKFLEEIKNPRKATPEEMQRILAGAERIKKCLILISSRYECCSSSVCLKITIGIDLV
ncbi:MAG: hypothetical protein IIX08_02920, partial [Bacteroidales bacterium]|nr:hypothetical protein [Bacteroidales bacterium]